MSRKQNDDASFLEEMARMGVSPVGRGRQGSGKGGQGRGKDGKSGVAGKGGGAGKAVPEGRSAPHLRPPAPARTAGEQHRQQGEVDRLKQREPAHLLEGMKAELAAAQAALARERQAREALEAERAAWIAERERLAAEAHGLCAERDGLSKKLEAAGQKLEAAGQKLAAAEQKLAAAEQKLDAHIPAQKVLTERGLHSEEEVIAALRGLLAVRASELLGTVELASGEPLRQLLDQRVALVGEGVEIELEECVVIRVEPPRCEITGGSDIRASFRRFVEACRAAKVQRITIVGGSPAYRRQLKILEEEAGHELKLNLVSGTQRREQKRADADMRASDLVVIWSGTQLDHSVSRLYSGGPNPIIQAPHRGISRMLDHVAEILKAQRRRPQR